MMLADHPPLEVQIDMKQKNSTQLYVYPIIISLILGIIQPSQAASTKKSPLADTIDLAGTWQFQLDKDNNGVNEKWFDKKLPDQIKLPGSTDEAGYGEKTTEREITRLTRKYRYVGPAWYQRQVIIPENWKDKRITLFLERCHWETQVWVDGKAMGMQESLCVPHIYDLTKTMTPGQHLLTIRVDNSIKYNIGTFQFYDLKGTWAHSVTDDTQTNWNGIIGRIALDASDPVWIQSVQVYPDIRKKFAKVKVRVANATNQVIDATLNLKAEEVEGKNPDPQQVKVSINPKQESTVEYDYDMGKDAKLWDEFSPVIYELTTVLSANAGNNQYTDVRKTQFGMRQIDTQGRKIKINDRWTFFRGNVDCCIFPLTGYPDMETKAWLRMFRIAKSYGLNHIRFHSWCPPEAAFVAADQLGITFQVETPVWTTVGSDNSVDQFIYDEGDRILETYGNHPSFTMLMVGNELAGRKRVQFCAEINKYWKEKDPRRLYSGGSGWPESPTADYHVLSKKGPPIRLNRGPLGPSTVPDYRIPISRSKKPIIAHEISPWCVYPNFKEIKKYTGVVEARNFEVFRESLRKNHMLDQADDFVKASGALSSLMMKAEIETNLRTPESAGFQMLCLQDFPGQGTSLVGKLDAFWDSKGILEPQECAEYCNQTVPLLRMKKRIYTTSETFTADMEVAHFGPSPIDHAIPVWSVKYADGGEIASGKSDVSAIPIGNCIKLGQITLPLSKVMAPNKLVITVSLKETPFHNHWEIWVYPDLPETYQPGNVMLAKRWDDTAGSALKAGRKVLFVPSPELLKKARRSSFQPIFWNNYLLKSQSSHMGILCDPQHPVFDEFPTEFHTNWQWWDLLEKSTAMVLDDFDPKFRPTIQLIDDWFTNHRLGYLFEAKAGNGKLVVCSLDILNNLGNRRAARQLLHSLLKYMNSNQFNPAQSVDIKLIEDLCRINHTQGAAK